MNFSTLVTMGSIVISATTFAAALTVGSGTTVLNQDLNEPLIINANDVTVDLNGHSIICTETAIQINGRSNVTVISTDQMAEVGASSTSPGISVVNSQDISISHIWVHERSNGVAVESSQRVQLSDINVYNCAFDGFRLRNSNEVDISRCESNYCTGGFDQNYGNMVNYSTCFAGGNKTNGFEIDYASAFNFDTCVSMLNGTVEDPSETRGKHGFSITNDSYYGYVTACYSLFNKGDGIHLKDASNISMTGCGAFNNEGQGFSFDDTSCYNWSTECNSNNNTSHGLKLDSTSVQNYFSQCIFNANGNDGIHIRNNSHTNSFYNCEAVSNTDEDLDDDDILNYYSECNFSVIN